MDLIIFFKAIGNLLFAAILMLAIVITSTFTLFFYVMKGLTPVLLHKKKCCFAG